TTTDNYTLSLHDALPIYKDELGGEIFMNTMQAFVRTDAKSGQVELQEMTIPTIDQDEVLIKVEAFGVGIHDRYFIPSQVSFPYRSEEHTSELQSRFDIVC